MNKRPEDEVDEPSEEELEELNEDLVKEEEKDQA